MDSPLLLLYLLPRLRPQCAVKFYLSNVLSLGTISNYLQITELQLQRLTIFKALVTAALG